MPSILELRALLSSEPIKLIADAMPGSTFRGDRGIWIGGPALVQVLGVFSTSLLAVDEAEVDAAGEDVDLVSRCSRCLRR